MRELFYHPMSPRLGVNVDHIATVRQARGGKAPDPVWAALEAQRAGADSIVCHLREDRRHIQDADVKVLKKKLRVPLNLEMAIHPDVVDVACQVRPHQVTLVPERRQELTTEGGLNLHRNAKKLQAAIEQLAKRVKVVSLFIDPDPEMILLALRWGIPMVELHTGTYADATNARDRKSCLKALTQAAELGSSQGIRIAVGHGLDYQNTAPMLAIPSVEELNIGYSIVGRALEVGFYQAVVEMKKLIAKKH